MKPFVVIPARGGSKGVPGKNIKPLAGKPLIFYTIEEARKVFSDDVIFVSTDSSSIKECVESIGLRIPFLRPPDLGLDATGTHEVLLHALEFIESTGYLPDTLILLQPTSPFRRAEHIIEAIELFTQEIEMVVSVKESSLNPYFNLFEENKKGWLIKSKKGNFSSRQLCPKVWQYNGAIYIINVASLKKKPISDFNRIRKYLMDDLSSHDIDTIIDWELAEIFAKKILLSQ